MKQRDDKRFPAIILTAFLVITLGIVVRFGSAWFESAGQLIFLDTTTYISEEKKTSEQQSNLRETKDRFEKGVIMLHAGEYAYSVTAFKRVLELAPELPEAYVNMGFAQFGLHHYAVARDYFLAAIELRPGQANAYWGLAVSLEALCDIPGARGAMRTFIHLSKDRSPYIRKAKAALMEWSAMESAAELRHTERAVDGFTCRPGDPFHSDAFKTEMP